MNIILKNQTDFKRIEYLSNCNILNMNFADDDLNLYGTTIMFDGCIWNNNYEETKDKRLSVEELKRLSEYLNKYNFNIFIIFDRKDITKEELNDEYCRTLCKIFSNNKNMIYVKSNLLHHIIKYKYKKLKLVDSLRELSIYDIILLSKENKVRYAYSKEINNKSYEEIMSVIKEELSSPWLI